MGLTLSSTGKSAFETNFVVKKKNPDDKIISIAGNPNVGKSTLFNALTGMNQHTGNWSGKTVANAFGYCKTKNNSYVLVDIPGTYSLSAHSKEEEIARDFICFSELDAVVVVCDATCLERSLILALQTLEITSRVVVCVNLLDEAEKKGIKIDLEGLSDILGVRVVGTVARKKNSLNSLLLALDSLSESDENQNTKAYRVCYPEQIENAITKIESTLSSQKCIPNTRWQAVKILERDNVAEKLTKITDNTLSALEKAETELKKEGFHKERLSSIIAAAAVNAGEEIAKKVVSHTKKAYASLDRKLDNILTRKPYAYIVMLLLLCFIFWLTVYGANFISQGLSKLFSELEILLQGLLDKMNPPAWLRGILIDGVWRVTAWVVSVMLPPMAIFFPLFTLLEDVGYLPRIAFNLDNPFKKCKSCGKQALTMCMGFGCNAAGVVGCRIIDSKRERILAAITNSLVPCNGRFPAIIAIISMFFVVSGSVLGGALTALILTGVILFGIAMTFFSTRLLSSTLLKGLPSSYTLEMPPYRKPQVLSVIVRSVFDRTLFVLGRALAVAVPAGAVIWLMANVTVDGQTLLKICSDFLDPFAKVLGLDGVILIAFILGFPANETVIPIIIMAYMSKGTLLELSSISQMKELFMANGWTSLTALNVIIFTLFHWPCSTTVLTVKKETGSLKWTALSILLPTALGMVLCALTNLIFSLF